MDWMRREKVDAKGAVNYTPIINKKKGHKTSTPQPWGNYTAFLLVIISFTFPCGRNHIYRPAGHFQPMAHVTFRCLHFAVALNHLQRHLLFDCIGHCARHSWLILRGFKIFTEDFHFFSVVGNVDFYFPDTAMDDLTPDPILNCLLLSLLKSLSFPLTPGQHGMARECSPRGCVVLWNQSRCSKCDSLLWWVSVWILWAVCFLKSYFLHVTKEYTVEERN